MGDAERPQTGLGERTREPTALGGGEPSDVKVPCKQCGTIFVVSALTVQSWKTCNAQLAKQGKPPLKPNEVACCDAPKCRAAERAAITKYADERDARLKTRRTAQRERRRRKNIDKEIA